MNEIEERVKEVFQRISSACERAGRDKKEVTLISVSKTMPVSAIRAAIKCGLHIFGENKVQELLKKEEELREHGLEWHMIGHLQTNKVKYLSGFSPLIHSLDSEKLALEIQKIGKKTGKILEVLVEINVAREQSKFGFYPEEIEPFLRKISSFSHLRVKGLMTVAPFTEEPEKNRVYFRTLRKIMVDLNEKNIDNVHMNVLSMGMTDDYEVAIEEGATHIRIGTGIFGERTYHP